MNFHISLRARQVLFGYEVTEDLGTVCGLRSTHPRTYRQEGMCLSELQAWGIVAEVCRAARELEVGKQTTPRLSAVYEFQRALPGGIEWEWCAACGYHDNFLMVMLDAVLENGCPPEVAKGTAKHSTKKGERAIDQVWLWLKEEGPQRKSDMSEFAYHLSHPTLPLVIEETRYAALQHNWRTGDYHGTWVDYARNNPSQFMLSLLRQGANFWGTNWATYARNGIIVQNEDGRWRAGHRPW